MHHRNTPRRHGRAIIHLAKTEQKTKSETERTRKQKTQDSGGEGELEHSYNASGDCFTTGWGPHANALESASAEHECTYDRRCETPIPLEDEFNLNIHWSFSYPNHHIRPLPGPHAYDSHNRTGRTNEAKQRDKGAKQDRGTQRGEATGEGGREATRGEKAYRNGCVSEGEDACRGEGKVKGRRRERKGKEEETSRLAQV